MAYPKRRVYRRKTTKRYVRKKAPRRRTVKGTDLLSLNSFGGGRSQRDTSNYKRAPVERPIKGVHRDNTKNDVLRSMLGGASRGSKYGGLLLKANGVPFADTFGDIASSLFGYGASQIDSKPYTFDNKAANALLSFFDGEKRPGNINKFVDKAFGAITNNMPAISDGFDQSFDFLKNLPNQNLPDSVESGLDFASESIEKIFNNPTLKNLPDSVESGLDFASDSIDKIMGAYDNTKKAVKHIPAAFDIYKNYYFNDDHDIRDQSAFRKVAQNTPQRAVIPEWKKNPDISKQIIDFQREKEDWWSNHHTQDSGYSNYSGDPYVVTEPIDRRSAIARDAAVLHERAQRGLWNKYRPVRQKPIVYDKFDYNDPRNSGYLI
jgi:hypothetical protein